nr:MAG TPA: hypothetical protein [Caudoviricetes sp.]
MTYIIPNLNSSSHYSSIHFLNCLCINTIEISSIINQSFHILDNCLSL